LKMPTKGKKKSAKSRLPSAARSASSTPRNAAVELSTIQTPALSPVEEANRESSDEETKPSLSQVNANAVAVAAAAASAAQAVASLSAIMPARTPEARENAWKAPAGFKLPPFRSAKIQSWVEAAEFAFTRAGVVSETERMALAHHAISESSEHYLARAVMKKFEFWSDLRRELLKVFGRSAEDKRRALAAAPHRGNMAPASYFALLVDATEAEDVNDKDLRDKFLNDLPDPIKLMVMDENLEDNWAMAAHADRLWNSLEAKRKAHAVSGDAACAVATEGACGGEKPKTELQAVREEFNAKFDKLASDMKEMCAGVRQTKNSSGNNSSKNKRTERSERIFIDGKGKSTAIITGNLERKLIAADAKMNAA